MKETAKFKERGSSVNFLHFPSIPSEMRISRRKFNSSSERERESPRSETKKPRQLIRCDSALRKGSSRDSTRDKCLPSPFPGRVHGIIACVEEKPGQKPGNKELRRVDEHAEFVVAFKARSLHASQGARRVAARRATQHSGIDSSGRLASGLIWHDDRTAEDDGEAWHRKTKKKKKLPRLRASPPSTRSFNQARSMNRPRNARSTVTSELHQANCLRPHLIFIIPWINLPISHLPVI